MKVKKLIGCARCGKTHEGLMFEKLKRPMVEPKATTWTHWAACPTNGQPILLQETVSKKR